MKKIIYFAATCAALVACNKQVNEQPLAFEQGQEVTLTVAAPDQTKMSNELSGSTINFKWEEGDQIKITVGSNSALFTVHELINGGLKASFKGVMPAGGNTFDVQYPAEDPVITTQTYSTSSPLPHNAMKFVSNGHPLDHLDIFMSPVNSALKLNLYGEGKTISKIEVKDGSANTYTLNINPAVTLPATAAQAQAFYIIVPAGTYKFKAKIYNNEATPKSICTLEPDNAQTLKAGHILNMPVLEATKIVPTGAVDLGLSVFWAEKNLGANAPYEVGRYFRFGDVVGQTWNGTSWSGGGFFNTAFTFECDANHHLKPEYDAAHVNLGGKWRMPTVEEIEELLSYAKTKWTESTDYQGSGVAGKIVTSTLPGFTDKFIFFPVTGWGDGNEICQNNYRGFYYSSTFSSYPYDLEIAVDIWGTSIGDGGVYSTDYAYMYYNGQCIRPVYPAE